MPPQLPTVVQPGTVRARHIRQGVSTDAGAVSVAGTWYTPQRGNGLNGQGGFTAGEYESRLLDEGKATVSFPNSIGGDGVLHRERFLLLALGKRTVTAGATIFTLAGGTYRIGDEWLELYWGDPGDCIYVGTPISATLTREQLTLTLVDGSYLPRKSRDSVAGFWAHAPRDVFEAATQPWTMLAASDFSDASSIPAYSTSGALSGDGVWLGTRAQADPVGTRVLLAPGAVGNASALNYATNVVLGPGSTNAKNFFRMEATVNWYGVQDVSDAVNSRLFFRLVATPTSAVDDITIGHLSNGWNYFKPQGTSTGRFQKALALRPGPFTYRIELRGDWLFAWINDELMGSCWWGNVVANITYVPQIYFDAVPQYSGVGDASATIGIDNFTIRQTRPLLMRNTLVSPGDKGDYTIPGVLPTGGLRAEYHNDSDFANETQAEHWLYALAPHRSDTVKYAERIDGPIQLSGAAWIPTGLPVVAASPGTAYFSVRWYGAIRLNLASSDIRLRISAPVGDAPFVRLRVGGQVLMAGQFVSGGVTCDYMRATLGSVNGWYPIVLESVWWGGSYPSFVTHGITLERDSGGGFATVPSTDLSPLGTFREHLRNESLADMLRMMGETFGLQYTLQPKSLESGLFPGLLVPRNRVGRDTERVLRSEEATDLQLAVTAEDTVDVLIADAQGLADPSGQMTLEDVNYSTVSGHLLIHEEYESAAEISDPSYLLQRLDSKLDLRGGVWEEVQARPPSAREWLDKFPVSGSYDVFSWQAGDGVRLDLPELAVKDANPRQIMGVSRAFTQGGMAQPTVAWRQRTRNLTESLRRAHQIALRQIRNYQGSLVTVSGTFGSAPDGIDVYSRLSPPLNWDDILGVWLDVQYKTNNSPWNIEINGVNVRSITLPGRFDCGNIQRSATQAGLPQLYARMTPAVGGSGSAAYALEMLVKK